MDFETKFALKTDALGKLFYNIASRATQSNSVYVSVLKIPIVHAHADGVSESLSRNFFFARAAIVSDHCLLNISHLPRTITSDVVVRFRVGFYAQFHRLCYKTIGSCF